MKHDLMSCCVFMLCLVVGLCALSNRTGMANCTTNSTDPQCCLPPDVAVNNTCVECMVEYCRQCSWEDVCSQCHAEYRLSNNNTECAPINGTQCKQGEYQANGTCHAKCGISMCQQCQRVQGINRTHYFKCAACHTTFNSSCLCANPNISINQTTCIVCQVPNCRLCSANGPSACEECLPGYTLQQNSTNCITQECQSQEYSYNGLCYRCGIDNCQQCGRRASNLSEMNQSLNASDNTNTSEQYCVQCAHGYTLAANSNSRACEFMCDQNQSYYNNTCVQCAVQDCRRCEQFDPHVCEECEYGSTNQSSVSCPPKSNANTTNEAVNCQGAIMFCKSCVKQGNSSTKLCSVCQQPYVLTKSTDNTTTSCSLPSCPDFLLYLKGSCRCRYGHYLNTAGNACLPCMAYCANCSGSGECVQCYEGYYYNSSSCVPCGANCDTCSGLQSCQICKQGYKLVFVGTISQCLALPTLITGLTSATLNGSTQSVVCQYGCSACSVVNSALACSSCIPGRYLQTTNVSGSSICMPCPSGCRICANRTYCTQCYDRYIVNATGQCSSCQQPNCLTCEGSASYCSICQPGYRLTSDNHCSKCPDRCVECSTTQCTACENGLIPLNGYCLECASGCSVCSPSNASQCTQCRNGFYLSGTGRCVGCEYGCRKCDSTGCLECEIQYLINTQKRCVTGCGSLCAECGLIADHQNSQNSIYNCTKCIYGYIMRNAVCLPKAGLLVDGFCKFADYWNGSACVGCNVSDAKCVNCQMTASQVVCTRCDIGYALEVTGCVPCANGCQNCFSRDNCINCKDGYYMQQVLGRNTGKCFPCSSSHQCNTCIYSASQCTTCKDGFIFEGFKCISKINIGMILRIDQIPSTMMLMLDDLKSEIMKSVKDKLRNQTQFVTVRSYVQGSTIVGMNITVPDDVTPVQTAYNIYYKVTNKDFPFKLLGSPVMNYNNYDPQPGENPERGWGNRTVGIIIACIFGLLLLGVIFLFMRMRKQQMDQQAAAPPPPRNENDIQLGPGTGQQLQEKQKSEMFDIQ